MHLGASSICFLPGTPSSSAEKPALVLENRTPELLQRDNGGLLVGEGDC